MHEVKAIIVGSVAGLFATAGASGNAVAQEMVHPYVAPQVKLASTIDDGRPALRWRGFNLLEMFSQGETHTPNEFREEDFALIHEWGFNFVRLPMDYRYWIKDGDSKNWEIFDEANLRYIDHAIALGRKYGIHVSICMHRAPGYWVGQTPESTDLFSDPEPLRVACLHWAMFARRYRDIPNAYLSFNLVNEPPSKPQEYARVAKAMIAAIHAEDPARFIISDGFDYGETPLADLYDIPHVGQAGRGYVPHRVTHYMAPWAGTPRTTPIWPPLVDAPEGMLSGSGKSDAYRPLEFADLPVGTLTISFGRASGPLALKFTADGEVVKRISITPDEGSALWRDVSLKKRWGIKQGVYLGRDVFTFSRPVKQFLIEVEKGDWIMLGDITFASIDGKFSISVSPQSSWGGSPRNFTQRFVDWKRGFRPDDTATIPYLDSGRQYLYSHMVKWDDPIKRGIFCFVGEFGVYNKTPHTITLALMEDYLRLWKERNLGWAMWNLRGTMGVLDSCRADVEYEDFRGHKLDRKMLDLLQRY